MVSMVGGVLVVAPPTTGLPPLLALTWAVSATGMAPLQLRSQRKLKREMGWPFWLLMKAMSETVTWPLPLESPRRVRKWTTAEGRVPVPSVAAMLVAAG